MTSPQGGASQLLNLLAAPDFTIYTAPMELVTGNQTGPHGGPVIQMVGSSTEKDLQGDTMTLSALQDMQHAPVGLSIWLNHSYKVPDDLFGGLLQAPTIISKGGIADLHLAVEAETSNPIALKTVEYVQHGRRLGCSLGGYVMDYELVETSKGVSEVHVTRIAIQEWSIVGIPANQRSWVENAVKGLFARTLDERLAPAVKSLFPRDYQRIVEGLPADDLRKHLLTIPARPSGARGPRYLAWDPNRQTYLLGGAGGHARDLDRNQVAVLLGYSADQPTSGAAPVADDEHQVSKADDSGDRDKAAQHARSSQYHIGIKDGGAVTKPSKWSSVPDAQWGDPVNYRYPMPDASHARNALSRWGDASNRSQYSSQEQSIIGGRIKRRASALGVNVSDDASVKALAPLLLLTLDDGTQLVYDDLVQVDDTYYVRQADQSLIPWLCEMNDETGEYMLIIKADGSHGPYTGSHTHAHKAMGSQGDDDLHEHTHSHDGDSNHEHSHAAKGAAPVIAEAPVAAPVAADPALTLAADDVATSSEGTDEPVVNPDPDPELVTAAADPVDLVDPVDPVDLVVPVIPVVDPVRAAMLMAYNTLGAQLGFTTRAFPSATDAGASADDPNLSTKSVIGDGDMQKIIALLTTIDEISDMLVFKSQKLDSCVDSLMAVVGVPDLDPVMGAMPGYSVDDLPTAKAGRRHSANDMGHLQAIHDAVMKLTNGKVCGAPTGQADGQAGGEGSNRGDQSRGENGSEDVANGQLHAGITDLPLADGLLHFATFKGLDLSPVQTVSDQLVALTQSLETLGVPALRTQIASSQTELASVKQQLATAQDQLTAIVTTLERVSDVKLPAPTRLPVSSPTSSTLSTLSTSPTRSFVSPVGDDTPSESAPVYDPATTLTDALAQTSLVRVKGIGLCRRWPAGVGQGLRPPLTLDHKALMTVDSVIDYKEGGEALVPLIDD